MRLQSIKKIEPLPVWDICVKDVHHFILENGVVAHNSMFSKTVVSGGCVLPETMIRMADLSHKPISEIQPGEYVDTLLGPREVTHSWNHETLDEGEPACYEVSFNDGTSITCSYKHRFLDVNGVWFYARHIIPGDLLAGSPLNNHQGSTLTVISIKKVGRKQVCDLSVDEAQHYIHENGLVSHNTGIYYSADCIFVIGRQQDKEGTDVVGYDFILNVEKSRYVKEKSKIPISISFNGGISKYSGLLEVALESGHIVKPKVGWYSTVNLDTGEISEKKYRAKDMVTDTFWNPILNDDKFKSFVESRYKIGYDKIMQDHEIDEELNLIDD